MSKPKLAILTDAIRFDNNHSLQYFRRFEVKHFYHQAPYGDLSDKDLKNAFRWTNFDDLEKKLLEFQPDIIQGAEPYASKTALRICLLTMKIANKLQIPYIFPVLENRPVFQRFDLITGAILKKIMKKYAHGAAKIFYLNDGAKKNLEEVGADPRKMVRILYGVWGVDTAVFRPQIQNAKCKSQNYILFVGRLDEAKGIRYILQAWDEIKDEFPKLELVFIGEGELANQIKGERIKKLNAKKTVDLPPYYSQALFTLYPSVTLKRWEEQIGTVNLQSLACGTPVVTTKSGAIPEYINDKVGILVPERDAKALAEAMRRLIKNRALREKLAKNARQYILDHYDAQKTVQKIEKILLELIHQK